MKQFILFAQAYIFSLLALPLALTAQDSDITFPNYVVIGAFAHEKNAITFTDEAKHNRYTARFEMNPHRNLYYVYVLTTDDREYARAEALRLRAETKYFDAWVYSGVFGNIDVPATTRGEQQDFNPVTGQRLDNVSAGEQQRSTAPGNNLPSATSDEQTTANANRLASNDPKGLHSSVPAKDRSNQHTTLTRNRGATTNGQGNAQNSLAHATRDEESIQHHDGVQRDANALTRTQQQTSLPPTRSDRKNNFADERQSDATTSRDAADPEEQNDDGDSERPSTRAEQTQASLRSNSSAEGNSVINEREAGATAERPREEKKVTGETITPGTAKDIENANAVEAQVTSGRSQNKSEGSAVVYEKDASMKTDEASVKNEVADIPPPVRQSTQPLSSEEVVGKNFYFHLYRADNLNTVAGEVDAIDFDRSRKMGTYPANEGVEVTMAGGKMKHISFVCQVFGYRKQQQEFDPESPSELLYLDNKGNLVVPFELVRLQKGDIAIMYNVFFFKDAAVMRPESRYEVNNLLDLLVENPSYNIIIHGHTNGNASGKIIRMNKPGNFYSLTGTKQGFGSAKQLSEERAIVIREFLISSGISADRMEVKAWGGKKPIHDKHSVRAQENVRVEIEILSE